MNRRHVLLGSAATLATGGYLLTRPQGGTPAGHLISPAYAQDADIDTSIIPEMQLGDPDAPVTVIEYASFTCPHCARFHVGPFKQLKADYIDTGKINFIYREVYFDRYGLWASMIARCGGGERFFGITDLIYARHDQWTRAGGPTEIADELRKIGRLAGLDDDTLEACLQDQTMARTLVAWYQENAEEHGIDSTPSFMINDRKYQNMSYADFSALIDEALGT
ncbi:DsbA family protein [Aestuariivita sp.]|uniref:DsbA family protein n=1 Tax=Aestuariivita sp. TaxID=1872407 RepID=UPI0021704D5F|nr:DsbA family protein [Aestuariivita sp.]MCE8007172.1 DsbA family protein [Aestuariivita sp.]